MSDSTDTSSRNTSPSALSSSDDMAHKPVSPLTSRLWGHVDGKEVRLYSLQNRNGVKLVLSNYGASIIELWAPDRHGKLADIALGYPTLEDYQRELASVGPVVGRYHNRIRNGRFELDGEPYQVSVNEGQHSLHSGLEFQKAVWQAQSFDSERGPGLRLRYFSPDGSHGFPGNVTSTVTYILTHDNEIDLHFYAEADRRTPLNFIQHAYFNLNGVSATVHDHIVRIDADNHAAYDKEALQTGRIESLRGQAFDLIEPTRIGDHFDDIALGGYHQTYLLNKEAGELKTVASVYEPVSGRTMDVATTSPSITFYVAMGLNNSVPGKYDIEYAPYKGFCLEAGYVPDSVNYAHFPSTIFGPDRPYDERVIFKLGVKQ
ncbi:aldose epimerase family protein [Agaribacterium haliotis]|uniref:aldose epimerase family protein n=1 Tax=Agaribacterium haliotis TaxID=2013869 RepID=UPI000BB595A5|nr:aldose epimerase family protein [Agaribacterium haliotis]